MKNKDQIFMYHKAKQKIPFRHNTFFIKLTAELFQLHNPTLP